MRREPNEKERFEILMENMNSQFQAVMENQNSMKSELKAELGTKFDSLSNRVSLLEKAVQKISIDVTDIKIQLVPMQHTLSNHETRITKLEQKPA